MTEPGASRLELMADPNAVGQARAWLKSRLGGWSPDGVATVQLLLSELVTNAILHTTDVVEVTAERSGSKVTVEVADSNPSKPVVKQYERDAATGRGLHLVEALADAWGVRGDERRKSVWFRVIDGTPSRRTVPGTGDDPAGPQGLHSWSGSAAGAQSAVAPLSGAGEPEVSVSLIGLPVGVYLAAEEHHDALVRELGMLLSSSRESSNRDGGARVVPARLVELAMGVVAEFGTGNDKRRAQVEAARLAGRETVDVTMQFPAGAQDQVVRTANELDEIDEFCRHADLLTPPSTEILRHFRRWYTDEIVRQLEGEPPTPWSA
jgi:anti-sigma regulatory factor (Ser/Thr protein kinase)